MEIYPPPPLVFLVIPSVTVVTVLQSVCQYMHTLLYLVLFISGAAHAGVVSGALEISIY